MVRVLCAQVNIMHMSAYTLLTHHVQTNTHIGTYTHTNTRTKTDIHTHSNQHTAMTDSQKVENIGLLAKTQSTNSSP